MNTRMLKILAGLAAVAAVALGGGAIAAATGAFDEGEAQLTGADADRAREAALRATGGGTANAVDREFDRGSGYEVEVTRKDGSAVDVSLDESFNVVAINGESEDRDDQRDDRGEQEAGRDDDQSDDDRGEQEGGPGDDRGVDDRGEREGSSGDVGEAVTGRAAERAGAAAVRAAGGGKATQVEKDSGDGATYEGDGATYEVEVTRDDGSKVDVDLNESFDVVAVDRNAE